MIKERKKEIYRLAEIANSLKLNNYLKEYTYFEWKIKWYCVILFKILPQVYLIKYIHADVKTFMKLCFRK